VAEHPFDPAAAMELIAAQERRTRTSFDGHLDQVLAAWGVAWLFGLGALWFQARGQSPYAGPQGWGADRLRLLAGGGGLAHRVADGPDDPRGRR
jgi:hypothetical protein